MGGFSKWGIWLNDRQAASDDSVADEVKPLRRVSLDIPGERLANALRLANGIDFVAHHRERCRIQYAGNRVADFAHDDAGAARFDGNAFVAFAEPGFAGAGQRGE